MALRRAGSPTKDVRSAVITLPNANRCFGSFWKEVQDPRMRARSPSTRSSRSGALAARAAATSTPCGRRRALRNRAAAGKSRRGENPPGQQRSTEHAPLRATRPWTTCARAPAVAVSGRALRLSLASHPDLPSTFIWYTGLATCARINQTVGGPKNQNYCIPLSYTTLPYHCSN